MSLLKRWLCKHDYRVYKDSWFIEGKIVKVTTSICKECEHVKEKRD